MSEVEEFLKVLKEHVNGDHDIGAVKEDDKYVVKVDGKKMNVPWAQDAANDLEKFHKINANEELARFAAIKINQYLGKK